MADTYTPTSGMKAAARRALKWKADGKAKGAGTPVGWGRATDIVNGSAMSLSTVKRMYSFFSRHEVDKKGKGFHYRDQVVKDAGECHRLLVDFLHRAMPETDWKHAEQLDD